MDKFTSFRFYLFETSLASHLNFALGHEKYYQTVQVTHLIHLSSTFSKKLVHSC